MILQKPDALSLSMNLKTLIVQATTETISFTLKKNGEILLSQSYQTDKNGRVEIDLRQVVHDSLKTVVSDTSAVYVQGNLAADFTASADMDTVSFRAIRGGVDRLADSATNFLSQNFLTWQPNSKPVTYYSPELLTYYAVTPSIVKLRAYFTDGSGNVTSQTDYTVYNMSAGNAYTIPLQYSVVAGWLGHRLPAYYDVWVENSSGQRLTYIQRYFAEDMRSEQEQWILFENSLGGIDTFRAYGTTTFNGEHTHNLAEIDEVSQEYRVDTERKFQKNTGHLNKEERRWLLDFFPSSAKYIYTGNYLRQIVVTESNVSYSDRDLPSNYTFTFKYADARPLLNLPRTEVPAEVLTITVPNVGSFTVPPRLAEFPRLPLSEGALIPIQSPYSEEWGTTTPAALTEFIGEAIKAEGGGGGNIDIDRCLRKDQPDSTQYPIDFMAGLSINSKRIGDVIRYYDGKKPVATDANIYSALMTDQRIEEEFGRIDDKYLRTDQPDIDPYHATFEEGITVYQLAETMNLDVKNLATIAQAVVSILRSSKFVDGFAGEGYRIWQDIADGDWCMTLDRLTVPCSSANGQVKS